MEAIGEFIEFAFLDNGEAYPVVRAVGPLYDKAREVGYEVDHQRRAILISPNISPGGLRAAIRNAVVRASAPCPVSLRGLPFVGGVE